MAVCAPTVPQRPTRWGHAYLRNPRIAALAVAIPLCALYLLLQPPAGDLAAATYRSDLFARVGFTTWDTGWYAAHGHWLPGYSLLAPALGALLGVRVLLALSVLAASFLFALIAERAFGRTRRDTSEAPLSASATTAAAVFAFGLCVGMLSGRVPFDLGFAIGLASVLAATRRRVALALALAVLTSVASPVAGAFLALTGVATASARWLTKARSAHTLSGRTLSASVSAPRAHAPRLGEESHIRLGLGLAAAALAPIAVLSIAFPEGGYEPFAGEAFWPALAGVLLFALLLPSGPLTQGQRQTLRVGAVLYAFALVASYLLRTPMGGNAARLGPLLAAPIVVGVLWEHRRLALSLVLPALLYWQLATALDDLTSDYGDPSVKASYYAPLIGELRRLDGVAAARSIARLAIVEVPLTRAHWEAAYLAGAPLPAGGRIALARGWERQLDTRYATLFYRSTLTPAAYRDWLATNRVSYVALPDVPLDEAGLLERGLIRAGLPYLRMVWRSPHWRLYRFG